MAHQITGIDHLRLAVGSLDAAGQAFARLGFSVGSPAGFSVGPYQIELVAETGLGGVAKVIDLGLGCRDLDASRESLRRCGIETVPPQSPENPAVRLSADLTSGVPASLGRQQDRTDIPQHPNSAGKLVSVTALLDDPDGAVSGFSRLFGPASCTPTDETVTVYTGNSLLFLVTSGGFDDLHPSLDIRLPPAPAIVVLTIGVRDITQTAAVLAAQGVAVKRWGGHLAVPAKDALGIGLEFVELTTRGNS
ncbi:hypothetical protein [Telmatospirillum sp.]|uniref:hypothetical protein n=1 Tax=Telmatospirillum sp. TaxID=2079197 RepID=UPI00283CE1B4|nr:hypothetical protein [Telmatospirillum sp.]MDR3438489.1 hypothetical protein [Telmatospirillum sp.]